jgi:hypothetical protein
MRLYWGTVQINGRCRTCVTAGCKRFKWNQYCLCPFNEAYLGEEILDACNYSCDARGCWLRTRDYADGFGRPGKRLCDQRRRRWKQQRAADSTLALGQPSWRSLSLGQPRSRWLSRSRLEPLALLIAPERDVIGGLDGNVRLVFLTKSHSTISASQSSGSFPLLPGAFAQAAGLNPAASGRG